jgi:hypothetical protein
VGWFYSCRKVTENIVLSCAIDNPGAALAVWLKSPNGKCRALSVFRAATTVHTLMRDGGYEKVFVLVLLSIESKRVCLC